MDFLDLGDVSFLANTNIGSLCEDLNNIVGQDFWYDTFNIKNSKWLWLVNNIDASMKKQNILLGSCGLYPSFVAGILISVEKIHFYVVCDEPLHYADNIENELQVKAVVFLISQCRMLFPFIISQ